MMINQIVDKEIKAAYKAGQAAKAKYGSLAEWAYSDDCDDALSPVEAIAWEMGFLGLALREVTGWRYGDIPKGGRSVNYRDNSYERGVSLMAIDGEDCGTEDTVVEGLFAAGRPVVRVRGYFSGRGATGEPLVIGARLI